MLYINIIHIRGKGQFEASQKYSKFDIKCTCEYVYYLIHEIVIFLLFFFFYLLVYSNKHVVKYKIIYLMEIGCSMPNNSIIINTLSVVKKKCIHIMVNNIFYFLHVPNTCCSPPQLPIHIQSAAIVVHIMLLI